MDRTPPTSRVRAPAGAHGRRLVLRISASDDGPPGVRSSGVRAVRVYRSVDGRPPRRVAVTRRRHVAVRVHQGAVNRFYTEAVDHAGNVETAPRHPDARTRVRAT